MGHALRAADAAVAREGSTALPHAYAASARAAAAICTPASPAVDAWDPLLLCIAAYILTSVGRVHQLFPGLEALHPAMLTGALAPLLWFADRTERRRVKNAWLPTTKYLVAFLGWMILSVPGSLSEGTSVQLVAGNFLKTAAMYVVTVSAVRNVKDVERLALVYLFSAAVYSLVVVARFSVGDGDAWRLGHLYYYDANDFATFAVTAICLGLYFLHTRRGVARLLAVSALVLLTMAFVRSGSRGGFLALAAVGVFVVLRYDAIPFRWRAGATALVAIVLIGSASDKYWEQMGTITAESDYNYHGETGRLQIWSRGLDYMLSHPILGVGPDNFPVAEGTLSPLAQRQQYGIGVRWSAAHDAYVQVGAELGVPGLIFFLAMLLTAFAALRRSRRQPAGAAGNARELSLALTAALLGFVVGAVFLSLAYSEMLYTLLALAVGLRKVAAMEIGTAA